MHANATLDRTSALVNVSLTQIFVATNALPHLQIDSTAEMLDRRRLGFRREGGDRWQVGFWSRLAQRSSRARLAGPEGMFATRLGHNQHPTSQPSAIQPAMRATFNI